jgi:hypothetical protein
VNGEAIAAGTPIQLYDGNGGNHQKWQLVGSGTPTTSPSASPSNPGNETVGTGNPRLRALTDRWGSGQPLPAALNGQSLRAR